MRTLVMALAFVASHGCKSGQAPSSTEQVAARRQTRVRALEAQLSVIATQPILIDTMARVFPLTEPGRARVTEKLEALQMRFDEAKNLIAAGDERASEAMKKLEDARKEAWDALDKAPRTDRSS